MSAITLIAAKSLKSAINAFGKTAKTFAEKQHQLAASAIAALNADGEMKYLVMLHDVTPLAYRPMLREYATNFGKVKWVAIDPETKAPVNKFVFVKGKKIDDELTAAMMTVSPTEYVKKAGKSGTGGKGTSDAFDYVAAIDSVQKRLASLMETFEKENVPPAICELLEVLHGRAESTVKAATKWRMANTVPAAPAAVETKAETAPAANPGRKGKGKAAPAIANENAEQAAPLAAVG